MHVSQKLVCVSLFKDQYEDANELSNLIHSHFFMVILAVRHTINSLLLIKKKTTPDIKCRLDKDQLYIYIDQSCLF